MFDNSPINRAILRQAVSRDAESAERSAPRLAATPPSRRRALRCRVAANGRYQAPPTPTSRRGIGMVEVVASSLIVGLMMVAALDAVGMAFRTRKINADRLIGPGLAQELMAEIMAMPYQDPDETTTTIGLDAGESSVNRSTYDDVDDYHNLNSTDAKAKDGTLLAGLTGWSQQATVSWANRTTGAGGATSDTGLKLITVTVTSPAGRQTQLVSLRAKDGAVEQPLPIPRQAVTWVGAELRVGSATRPAHAGVPLANHAVDAN